MQRTLEQGLAADLGQTLGSIACQCMEATASSGGKDYRAPNGRRLVRRGGRLVTDSRPDLLSGIASHASAPAVALVRSVPQARLLAAEEVKYSRSRSIPSV